MSNIVYCPHCTGILYKTANITDTPFMATVGKPPKIHQANGKAFMFCPNNSCNRKVFMIAAGSGFRLSPIQS